MVDGFVLAGGRSSRMGVDKARIPVDGWPMALAVVRALAEVCDRVVVVRRGPPDGLPWIDRDGRALEVVREADDGAPHPLFGVVTALDHARTDHVVTAPCDVPFLTGASVRALVAAGPGVVAEGSPLIGVFPRSLRAHLLAAAIAGGSVFAAVRGMATVELPPAELRNVNRWDDLARPSPLDRLAALPGAGPATREGEVARMRHRGVVLPAGSGT